MYMRFVEWVERTPAAQVLVVIVVFVLVLIGEFLIELAPV